MMNKISPKVYSNPYPINPSVSKLHQWRFEFLSFKNEELKIENKKMKMLFKEIQDMIDFYADGSYFNASRYLRFNQITEQGLENLEKELKLLYRG